MKKLLIAMTAAAVGTCAWAEEVVGGEGDSTPAAPTMLNETFGADWTLKAPWSYWSGAETATPADGELTAGDALTLNTGSKVLRGNFMSDGSAKDIDTGLYFKSTVTFSDPSDTLPELGSNDKFALVVLDNVESIDAGYTTTPATNLWVIAGHKTDGKRAYLLQPFANDDDDYNLTDSWFDTSKTIEVRAIQNVMATGNLAGFIVKVGTVICRVVKSYPIVNDVIDMSTSEGTTYLGYSAEEIDATYRKRYETDKTLIVSAASSSTLTSVDFQGQGVIDDVSLATTGSDFGSDAAVLTFAGYDATKIASITVAGKTVTGGAYTILGNEDKDADNKSTITVTVQAGYVLDMTGWTKNGLTYTYLYELPTTSAAITLNVFAPAAYVGDKAYETFGKALEKVTAGATIELADNVMVENETSFAISGNITIDLKGKTIASPAPETLAVFEVSDGTLTITDSVSGGKVDGAIIGNESAVYNLIGGSFKNVYPFVLCEGEDVLTFKFPGAGNGFTASEPTNGYYVITAASTYPESDKLVDSSDVTLSEDDKKAIKDTFDAIAGAATDKDAAVTNYINTVYGATVPATALIGANSVDISVKFNLPLMKTETPTIEVAPATVTADSDNAAAFEFTIKDGDNALTLSQAAKVLEMVQYVADLADEWAAATAADVDTSVNAGKAKVELKAKTGVNKGFMRLKLR